MISSYGDGLENENKISVNTIYNNNGLGIDLCPSCNSTVNGDGVTANDGNKNYTPNMRMDYPIFTDATISGNILHVEGFVGSESGQATFANATIEVFKAFNDGDNNGELIAGDGENIAHGEGRWYLGTNNTDDTGNFSADITVPQHISLNPGDSLTATATDMDNNSSEFSPNFLARTLEADLLVEKEVNDYTPNVGDNIIFTIKVTNNGPDDASTGIWTLGNIGCGNEAVLKITTLVTQQHVINNTAMVAGEQSDPDSSNNSDYVSINPLPALPVGEVAYLVNSSGF